MKRVNWIFAGVAALGLALPGIALADDTNSPEKWPDNGAGRVEPRQIVPVPDVDSQEDLQIEVWMRGGERRTLYPGDRVTVYFRTNRDAFVLLYDVDTEGRVHQIYPRSRWDDEFVQGGVAYAVPGRNAGYRLMVTGPAGREDIVALASDRPLVERWDECWGGLTSANDYDYLGGVRLRTGRLSSNRMAGMDRLTQKLVEVPDDDSYSDTAMDQVSFRVGHRYYNDGSGPWGRDRGRWGDGRW